MSVIRCDVSVKEIMKKGKKYKGWKKYIKKKCPSCGTKLWGHGFVLAYFSMIPGWILIRRVRCPNCKQVHRLKPSGVWKNFNHSASEIKSSIKNYVKRRRNPGNKIKRETIKQWIYRLKRMIRAVISVSFSGSLLEGFDKLLKIRIIPVSRAKNYKNRTIV